MQKYVLFIGIDISKKWFDVAIYEQNNLKGMPHCRFDQNSTGYKALMKWVSDYAEKHKLKGQYLFCMEHTGMYALSLCQFLDEQKQTYVLENPLWIKRSLGLRRGKSDKADSKAIAEFIWRNQDRVGKARALPNELLLKVQALLSLRQRLVRYHHGLRMAQGELTACIKAEISQLVATQTEQMTKVMTKVERDILKQIKTLICSDEHLKKVYELACSVCGIGEIIASFLLVYTNGFTAFDSAKQFSSYIGIVPFDDDSGTSQNHVPEVSKIANKKMKVLLTTAAVTATQHDPQIKAYFQRQLDKGKEEGWIYNAIKNKIVHRVFKVVKRGTPYVKLDF
jgi:transposase